jgi:hypothetical protein
MLISFFIKMIHINAEELKENKSNKLNFGFSKRLLNFNTKKSNL